LAIHLLGPCTFLFQNEPHLAKFLVQHLDLIILNFPQIPHLLFMPLPIIMLDLLNLKLEILNRHFQQFGLSQARSDIVPVDENDFSELVIDDSRKRVELHFFHDAEVLGIISEGVPLLISQKGLEDHKDPILPRGNDVPAARGALDLNNIAHMGGHSLLGQPVKALGEDLEVAVLSAPDVAGVVLLGEQPLQLGDLHGAQVEGLAGDVVADQPELAGHVAVGLLARHDHRVGQRVVGHRRKPAHALREGRAGPVRGLPFQHRALDAHADQEVIQPAENQVRHHVVVPLQDGYRLQGERLEDVDRVAYEFWFGAGCGQQVASVRELELGGPPEHDLPVPVQLLAEHVKQPDLVRTPHREVIPGRVESQAEQRVLDMLFLLAVVFEGEKPDQLAVGVFVVPDPDRVVVLRAGGDQRPLGADVHGCDRGPVEAFVDIVEVNILVLEFGLLLGQDAFVLGLDDLGHVDGGDVVVGEGHGHGVLPRVDVDAADLALALGCH
jgi:hypothetical protein